MIETAFDPSKAAVEALVYRWVTYQWSPPKAWAPGGEKLFPSYTSARKILRRRNIYYAIATMLDCLQRGEVPHLGKLLSQTARGHLLADGAILAFYSDNKADDAMVAAFATSKYMPVTVEIRRLGLEALGWYLSQVPRDIAREREY